MSSYTPNITQLQESNSTTYADLVGIHDWIDSTCWGNF